MAVPCGKLRRTANPEKAPAQPGQVRAAAPGEYAYQTSDFLQRRNTADGQRNVEPIRQRNAHTYPAGHPRAIHQRAAHDQKKIWTRAEQGQKMQARDHQKLLPCRHVGSPSIQLKGRSLPT